MPETMPSLTRQLLVAVPGMDDPRFARTVTLICQHDAEGAMGIVVNRASDFSLGEVLAQMSLSMPSPGLQAQPVLAGGPLQPERGFMVHDGAQAWASSLVLGEDLAITTSRDVLEALAAGEGPPHSALALGYAGWGAGQLEQELADNAWITVPSSHQLLFELPLEQRWQAAAGSIGVDLSRMADYSGRA